MKTLRIVFVGLLVLMVIASCATMTGEKAPDEMFEYEAVKDVPGISQDQLFTRSSQWFVETFVDSSSVIEFQDKESGEISGKYVYTYSEGVYTYAVRSTIQISIRDERYRFRASNAHYRITSGMGTIYPESQTPYRPLESLEGLKRAQSEWSGLESRYFEYVQTEDDF